MMTRHFNHITRGLMIASISLVAMSYAAVKSNQVSMVDRQNQDLATIVPPPDPNAVVNLVAVGDIMIGSLFPSKDFLPKDDAKHSFDAVLPFLKGDVVFGNLEGSLIDNGTSSKCPPAAINNPPNKAGNNAASYLTAAPTQPTKTTTSSTKAQTSDKTSDKLSDKPSDSPPPRTCYAFGMPTRYAQVIKDAGFNLVSIANNHVGDFGDAGRASTSSTLDKVGIYHAGLLSKPTTTFTVNGIKYGFVAFAPNIGTVSINDIDNAKKLVKELNKKVDIVIVYMHGGGEGADNTHVPKTDELYLNENRGNVYAFAHTMIDNGADVVLGSGPHVTRAMEVYKNKIIAYSLGNFNTYGAFNLKGVAGISPILNISLAKNGDFVFANVTSSKQSKENGLQLDNTHQAFNELKCLTQADFPETPLEFKNHMVTLKSASANSALSTSEAKP